MVSRTWFFAPLLILACSATATAQPLGTFRWQLQPYCNVVTVTVTQNGGIYRLEGTDDRCGAAQSSSVIGTAFLNPDGSIGLGLNIVAGPSGHGVPLSASIALATLRGTWNDEAGHGGPFVPTPGAGTGGSGRPLPPPPSTIPPVIRLQDDGGFLAGGSVDNGLIPASGPGTRMMWHPRKAAFRAGQVNGSQWDDANIGSRSTAMGLSTTASGEASTAMGNGTKASGNAASTAMGSYTTASGAGSTAMGSTTTASGDYSTAIGIGTTATGPHSTAMGDQTTAIGPASTSMGFRTTASGDASSALGSNTTASGAYSTATGAGTTASGNSSSAMGNLAVASGDVSFAAGNAAQAVGRHSVAIGAGATANGDESVALGQGFTTAGATGSFVFGDRSSATAQAAFAPNTFVVRASGGARFFSHATSDLGPVLLAGGTDWIAASDVNLKHRFRELDGEDVLGRIARMPVTEWSYKAQDPAVRHIGPTAQDFYAAFGLGQDRLRISPLDSGGVALAGVRALEVRTRELPRKSAGHTAENAALSSRLMAAEAEIAALRERLHRLEGTLQSLVPQVAQATGRR